MLSKVFILDDWDRLENGRRGPARPWKTWVIGSRPCRWDPAEGQLVCTASGEPCRDGIVVIHWSFFLGHFGDDETAHEHAEGKLGALAESDASFVMVVISGEEQSARADIPKRLHYRQIEVNEFQHEPFPTYLAEFRRRFGDGEIDFSVLSPEPRPAALLEIKSSLQFGESVSDPGLWRAAQAEFLRGARRGNGERSTPDDEVEWVGRAKWPDELLETPTARAKFLAAIEAIEADRRIRDRV